MKKTHLPFTADLYVQVRSKSVEREAASAAGVRYDVSVRITGKYFVFSLSTKTCSIR